MTDIWSKKQLRSMYDPTTGGYWFSATDICAIITDSDHKTAGVYWRKFKSGKNKNQPVTESNGLKLKSSNGKYHFTDVIDFKNLIKFIQTCPSPNANVYRLWVADMLFDGVPIAELEKELAKLGTDAAAEIAKKYANEPKGSTCA